MMRTGKGYVYWGDNKCMDIALFLVHENVRHLSVAESCNFLTESIIYIDDPVFFLDLFISLFRVMCPGKYIFISSWQDILKINLANSLNVKYMN